MQKIEQTQNWYQSTEIAHHNAWSLEPIFSSTVNRHSDLFICFAHKKWDSEWVTVMTTTSTAVLKTTCNLECTSLPWVMWIYEVDELVAPLEKRLHIFCSN